MDVNSLQTKACLPVSVVVPCFCCAETIDRAVASVARQTALPAEMIFVDDASPDGGATLAHLHRLQELYGKQISIRVIALDKNVGAGSARNEGWSAATQPYVAFLDADDAYHPKKIEIQYQYLMAHPDIALCGHAHRILERTADLPSWGVSEGAAQVISGLSILLSNPFVTPSVMVKRDVPFRFLEGRRHMEDHLLWMQIVRAGWKAVKLPEVLAAIYKPSYGASGLSSSLYHMERGELDNYRQLYFGGSINRLQWTVLTVYSLLKYMRRLVIVAWRKLPVVGRSSNPGGCP